MNKVKAFAPANISLVFSVYEHNDPKEKGSYGLGFTLSEGVIAEVSQSQKTEITFNNNVIEFPTVMQVIKNLTNKNVRVSLSSKLPLGCGFGLSGASALATAYALNEFLGLSKTKKELAVISHVAEVQNGTGLGDVVNQYYGGFLLKTKPSSEFIIQRIFTTDIPIYLQWYSAKETAKVLKDAKAIRQINSAGTAALSKVKTLRKNSSLQFSDILQIAKVFALQSGLLTDKKVKKTIANIEKQGGHASMVMLGNTVVSTIPFLGSKKITMSKQAARCL